MQSDQSQYDQFDLHMEEEVEDEEEEDEEKLEEQEQSQQNITKQLQLEKHSGQQRSDKTSSQRIFSNEFQNSSKVSVNIWKCRYEKSELTETVEKFSKVNSQMLYYYFLLKDLSKQTYYFLFQYQFDFQALRLQKDAKRLVKSTSLSKIELKMLMGFYQTPNQFQNDIYLMFDNFICLNSHNQSIINAVQHIKKQYHRRVCNILDYSSQVKEVQYQLEMYRFLNEIQNQSNTRQMKQRDQKMAKFITEQDKLQMIEALNNLSPLKKQHLKKQIELNFSDPNLSKGVLFFDDLDGDNLIKLLRIAEKYTQYQPRKVDIEQILQSEGIQRQASSSVQKSREDDFQSSFDSNYQSD